MSTEQARVWEIVEKAALAVTDATTGRFESKALADEIAKRLKDKQTPESVRATTAAMQATTLAARFVARRNPRPSQSPTLFDAGFVLPLGDGIRVWMAKATTDDALRWAALSTGNLSRVAIAEGARQKYVAERVEAWREHPDWKLGQLEREVFDHEEVIVDDGPEPSDDPDEASWDD